VADQTLLYTRRRTTVNLRDNRENNSSNVDTDSRNKKLIVLIDLMVGAA